MKEGDKLFCKRNYSFNEHHKWVTKGKYYVIHYDECYDQYYIIDDENEENLEIISQQYGNLNKYFLTLKESRKRKLKIIYENSHM